MKGVRRETIFVAFTLRFLHTLELLQQQKPEMIFSLLQHIGIPSQFLNDQKLK